MMINIKLMTGRKEILSPSIYDTFSGSSLKSFGPRNNSLPNIFTSLSNQEKIAKTNAKSSSRIYNSTDSLSRLNKINTEKVVHLFKSLKIENPSPNSKNPCFITINKNFKKRGSVIIDYIKSNSKPFDYLVSESTLESKKRIEQEKARKLNKKEIEEINSKLKEIISQKKSQIDLQIEKNIDNLNKKGIFPMSINKLREESKVLPKLRKVISLEKKRIYLDYTLRQRKKLNIEAFQSNLGLTMKEKYDWENKRKSNILKEIKEVIVKDSQKSEIPVSRAENESEDENDSGQNLKEISDYVKWFNKEGMKNYKTAPVKYLTKF
ncbi:unnamed protein product [Blepharisma stoltei]|uniref:Uncharacterized protein n=1 Tax=Blepharisma stoltei TaxID=1481888 RepID=A0AAU9K8X1_9CILI|nr:unnamed protein product [Blepharisma stoltei]